MLKKSILAGAMTFLALSTNSYGFPTATSLLHQMPQRATHRTADTDVCANFTGTWKGTCSAAGHTVEDTTTIQQNGCGVVIIGNEAVVVGSLSSNSGTIPGTAVQAPIALGYSLASATGWSPDRNELRYDLGVMVKGIGADDTATLRGAGRLRLDGTKLYAEMGIDSFKVSCIYDRQ